MIPTIKHSIAHNNWLPSHVIVSYWFGKIFFQIPLVSSKISFRGQILFNAHNINQVNDARVAILKCLNNHDNALENRIIQIKAPAKNIQIVPISKFLIASIIVSYIHSNTSIKLPEIPGRIIAQIAIEPHKKVHRQVEVIVRGVFVGDVIKNAIIQNNIRKKTVFQSHLTCFQRKIADINIRPMKNDHIKIG